MSQVNFLPRSYIERKARRARTVRQTALVSCVIAAVGAWYVGSRHSLADLDSYARSLESQAHAAADQVSEVKQLEAKLDELHRDHAAMRQIVPSISTTNLIAAVSARVPSGVAVTNLHVRGEPPRPAEKLASGLSQPTLPTQERRIPPVKIEMTGIAPGDEKIADFVGRLSEFAAFTNVKMVYSRSVQSGQLLGREFRVEMETPMNREYQPVDAEQGGRHAP